MLKKRIIPLLLFKNNRLVKGVNFSNFRDVGDPVKSCMVYNDQDADEIIIFNIDGDKGFYELSKILPLITKSVFMPITIGGGVDCYEKAAFLIKNGADKICVNTSAYTDKYLIRDVSNDFGSQSVVVCMDVRFSEGDFHLFSSNGSKLEPVKVEDHILDVINSGAGEIILQSIDKDGSMLNYEMQLATLSREFFKTPFIISGGCKDYESIKDVFLKTNFSAVCCGSIFNFSDSSPLRAKSFLSNYEIPLKII